MSTRRPRILVIDAEPQVHSLLGPALEAAGYDTLGVATGEAGLVAVVNRPPDAVILDISLPDIDGLEILRRARGFYKGPLLVLSARNTEAEKIKALDLGADDYVEKPLHVGEFLARLRVAMRNRVNWSASPAVVKAGAVEIDLIKRLVVRDGSLVRLSPLEYELLRRLVEGRGGVLTHRQLLTSVWGAGHARDVQYLRVFIGRLRQKLEANPMSPRYLITESRIGYRFVAD